MHNDRDGDDADVTYALVAMAFVYIKQGQTPAAEEINGIG